MTKIIPLTNMNLVMPKVGAKHEVMFNKSTSAELKVVLSCSFKCDRIHKSYCYGSTQTLLCCLSLIFLL
jgi:hypothetical protein